MTVNISKPSINIREKLAELDKPSGIAGEAVLRADSVQEIRSQIGAGRKNLIINGGMQIAQRGILATDIDSNKYTTVDRFIGEHDPTYYTINTEQVADSPNGFDHSFKVSVTAVTGTPATSSYVIPFESRFENSTLTPLSLGTSDSKPLSLSFWVKSNDTGTKYVDFVLGGYYGGDRTLSKSYTIDTADVWEKKVIHLPPSPATIASLPPPNYNGLSIFWWMSAGTDFTSGTENPVWGPQVATNRAPDMGSGAVSGSYYQMTGVQLELGSVATDFEHRSYGEELALCQRYYQILDFTRSQLGVLHRATSSGAGLPYAFIPLTTTMRAYPSMTTSGTWGTGADQAGTPTLYETSYSNVTLRGNNGNIADGGAQWLRGGFCNFDAEL